MVNYGKLWYIMVFKDILKHFTVCFGILWQIMEFYGILRYSMVFYGILWYFMVYYGILWYFMVYLWYFMVYYGILWYIIVGGVGGACTCSCCHNLHSDRHMIDLQNSESNS